MLIIRRRKTAMATTKKANKKENKLNIILFIIYNVILLLLLCIRLLLLVRIFIYILHLSKITKEDFLLCIFQTFFYLKTAFDFLYFLLLHTNENYKGKSIRIFISVCVFQYKIKIFMSLMILITNTFVQQLPTVGISEVEVK